MKLKNIIISSLFLLFILMISTVSATSYTHNTTISSELTDTPIPNTDNIITDKSDHTHDIVSHEKEITNDNKTSNSDTTSEKNTIKIQSKNSNTETNVLKNGKTGTFNDLNEEISKATNEIRLNQNYKFNSETKFKNGITINKDLTIYGNGHTINANNGARIFNVIENSALTLINLTLINGNGNRENGGVITSTGTLKIYNSTLINTNSKNNGGAIYISDGDLLIQNCTFINTTTSNHGGAIYISNGIMNIINSKFINNTAYSYGGVIAHENNANSIKESNILRTQIINATSIDDAGGAIYLKYTKFNANYVNITSSKANFGGAITSLKTNLKLSYCNIINSAAKYDGGAIYQMYNSLSITNSIFSNTNAKNGGAIYLILTENTITNNKFNNNHANNEGNVIYLLLNQTTKIKGNNYNNQINPLYETSDILKSISNGDYTIYHINISDKKLPNKYDLRDYGYVTPVKDQKYGGNCWAFATIGALESAILKANGKSLDLSEENMKNLMALYSIYGQCIEANEGGTEYMSLGYLTSWLGPTYEYEDIYDDSSTLSPVLNSLMHIQNIIYITRNSYTDNNAIKEAIMKYGAVGTYMCMDEAYLKGDSSYYYYGSDDINHAVIIVGWDDNYSKNNFKGNPKGNGAWIVKNSWGTEWGKKGYFYVSYYDKLFAMGDNIAYAFILNDTIKYDKNYQYEIIPTTQNTYDKNTVWYKNIFNSTDNEYLTAVSTYFLKDSNWELTINVNNIPKYNQIGFSNAGYYTINLNQMIPLNMGDIFEVIFKISSNNKVELLFSNGNYVNYMIHEKNVSFISNNGLKWTDLYDSYTIACIKAFTILNPINTALTLDIQNITESTVDLIATIYNQYGYPVNSGKVRFKIGDNEEIVTVENGIAKLNTLITDINVSARFEEVGYNPSMDSKLIPNILIPTEIDFTVSSINNPVNISAHITNLEGKTINSGFVIFNDGYKNYTANVINGFANLTNIFLKIGENNITATYQNPSYYKTSTKTITTNILAIKSKIELIINSIETPIEIIANITNLEGNPINSGIVTFNLSNNIYTKEVLDGIARITHDFIKLGLNNITAIYTDNPINTTYSESNTNKEVNVIKRVELNLIENLDKNNLKMDISINNITDYELNIYINNKTYNTTISSDGHKMLELNNLNDGKYKYLISLISPIYVAQNLTGEINVTVIKTNITASDAVIYKNGNYSVALKDKYNTPLPNKEIILKINSQTYKTSTNEQGIAIFTLNLDVNTYNATIEFLGTDEYLNSTTTRQITIKYLTTFTITVSNSTTDKPITINVKEPNHFNGTVAVNINEITCNVTLKDGEGTNTIQINTPGEYIATINYSGNKIFNATTTKSEPFTVKYLTKFIIEPITNTTTDKNIKLNITEMHGFNGTITLKIGTIEYNIALNNGNSPNNTIKLIPGKYQVVLNFTGNKNFTETYTTSNQFTVKYPTRFEIKNIVDFTEGSNIEIIITENNNYTGQVTLNIASETYEINLINGLGKISITPQLTPGTYTAKIDFTGNEKYSNTSTTSNNFKISPKPQPTTKTTNTKTTTTTKILAKQKTFKQKIKIKKYTITLKNKNNKPIKKEKVTLKLGKKTYKARTNSKGKATFKIKKLNRKGTYTAIIKYNGNKNNKRVTKKVKIRIK